MRSPIKWLVLTVVLVSGVLAYGAMSTPAAASSHLLLADFEVPSLGSDDFLIHSPYYDPTVKALFIADSDVWGDEVVGLVKNSYTSACVPPADDNQLLGTGRATLNEVRSGFPILALFDIPYAGPVTVTVDVQALEGTQFTLSLFDPDGNVVASQMETVTSASAGACYGGDPRARTTVSATVSSGAVVAARMEVDGGQVFVIDNFMVEGALAINECNGQAPTLMAQPGQVTVGTPNPDVILGTIWDDVILGLEGDDVICALSGDDIVLGGDGNDWVDGGQGNDLLRGGKGADRMYGRAGDDILQGNAGRDVLRGNAGHDLINGGLGNDWLFGGRGDDVVRGHQGNDRLFGGPGDDLLGGGPGDDGFRCGPGTDIAYGGSGTDATLDASCETALLIP